MNIQSTKKLTSTLLACILMLGVAISASAAEPAKETVKVIASTELTKSILVGDDTRKSDSPKSVQVKVIPLDEAVSDNITVSVVPMSKLVRLSDAKAFDKQDSIHEIRLVPAEISVDMVTVDADGKESSSKAMRLVPAKKIQMEKIIME